MQTGGGPKIGKILRTSHTNPYTNICLDPYLKPYSKPYPNPYRNPYPEPGVSNVRPAGRMRQRWMVCVTLFLLSNITVIYINEYFRPSLHFRYEPVKFGGGGGP